MQGQAAGGNLPEFLNDKRVQIGIVAAVVLIVIGVIAFMMFGNQQSASTGAGMEGMPPGAEMMNGPDDMMMGNGPGMPGDPGMMAMDPAMGGMPGMDPMMGGMPGAAAQPPAQEKPAKGLPKAVPSRKNPFQPNKDIAEVLESIAVPDTTVNSLPHDLYSELSPPKPAVANEGEEDGGPPVPPMRVAGVMMGAQVSAIMQMGNETFQVTPGKMIPESNPTYRVERIEQDKVFLSRRWEFGPRKGTQKIEVGLAGSAVPITAGAYPGMMGGIPGMGGAGGNGPR